MSFGSVAVWVDRGNERAPEQRFYFHDILPSLKLLFNYYRIYLMQIFFHYLFKLTFKEQLIFGINQPITEDSHALMSPNFYEFTVVSATNICNLK